VSWSKETIRQFSGMEVPISRAVKRPSGKCDKREFGNGRAALGGRWLKVWVASFWGILVSWIYCPMVLEAQVTGEGSSLQYQRVDQVRYKNPEDGMVATVSGRIRRMSAAQIEIVSEEKKNKRIPWNFVLSYQVHSSAGFRKGKQLAAAGNYLEAKKEFTRVENSGQSPPWLKRLAGIRKIQCLQVSNQESSAMTAFISLSAKHPKWIPWDGIPLCWEVDPIQSKRVAGKVRDWLDEPKNPIKVLVAASYGLNIPGSRETSIILLKKLKNSRSQLGSQAVAADLAGIQLMRIGGQFSEKEKAKFEALVAKLPFEARAGPMIFLGKKLKRVGKKKEACVVWLKVSSQYPDNHYLSLLGLNNAFYTLQSSGDPQAITVGRWLKRRFPDSIQARSLPKL